MRFKPNQLKFSLKLLADQSVVLVECPGREPQLFLPTLLDDAIVLQNVVFDYDTPEPVQQKPKLPVPRMIMPEKKTTIQSETDSIKPGSSHKPHSSASVHSSGISTVSLKRSSFQWVRSGKSINNKRCRMPYSWEKPVPVLGPSIEPTISAINKATQELRLEPFKLPSKVNYTTASQFDSLRTIYLDPKIDRNMRAIKK